MSACCRVGGTTGFPSPVPCLGTVAGGRAPGAPKATTWLGPMARGGGGSIHWDLGEIVGWGQRAGSEGEDLGGGNGGGGSGRPAVHDEVEEEPCWTEQFANCLEMIMEVIITGIRRPGGVTKRWAECGTKIFF